MAKKKEETKLLSLSRVLDKEELDSVKASKNRFDKPYERAFSIFLEAQRYYNTSEREDYETSDTAMETSGEIPLSSKASVVLLSVSGRKIISVSRVANH